MGSSARTCGAEDNALSNALRTVPAPPVLRVTRGTAPNWHLWCSLTLFALVVWDGILPRCFEAHLAAKQPRGVGNDAQPSPEPMVLPFGKAR